MKKPSRGTASYNKWLAEEIIRIASELDVAVSRLRRSDFRRLCRPTAAHSDFDKWSSKRRMAERYLDIPIAGPRATGDLPLEPVPEGYQVKTVSTQIGLDGVERQWIKAPLLNASGTLIDAVPEGHTIDGVSTLVGGDGQTSLQWVKTKKDKESREEVLARLVADLPSKVTARKGTVTKPTSKASKDILAVYPMGDPHIGMLSWKKETGDSFDLVKAKKILCNAISELVLRGPRTEQALVINLGDFFHSDNASNRTARAGNALDVDGRWPKVLQVGIGVMVFMIDRVLLHHDNVRVINEIGNHDDHSAIFLSIALDSYYRNEPRVEIDMSPAHFHWYRFGKNLIGVTHGHNQKHGDLESIMSADRAKDWGETLHRFWYCGHIHHSIKREMRGCVIESFRTLAPKDEYAATAGYRAGRDMNRISLHREYGEIGRETVNAAYLQEMYGD